MCITIYPQEQRDTGKRENSDRKCATRSLIGTYVPVNVINVHGDKMESEEFIKLLDDAAIEVKALSFTKQIEKKRRAVYKDRDSIEHIAASQGWDQVRKDIGYAITQLIEEYNRAQTLDWVRDPVQYALYHTWRRREDAKQDEMQILQISKELRKRP